MPIEHRNCKNHPNRPALGICIITREPICGECSTRYEGVNYSREGLALLHQQRARETALVGGGRRALSITMWCLTPGLLYLLYLSFTSSAELLMTLLHRAPQ